MMKKERKSAHYYYYYYYYCGGGGSGGDGPTHTTAQDFAVGRTRGCCLSHFIFDRAQLEQVRLDGKR